MGRHDRHRNRHSGEERADRESQEYQEYDERQEEYASQSDGDSPDDTADETSAGSGIGFGKEVKIGLAVIVGLLVILAIVVWSRMGPSEDSPPAADEKVASTEPGKAVGKDEKRPAFPAPSKSAQELTASDPFVPPAVSGKKAAGGLADWGPTGAGRGKSGKNDPTAKSAPPNFMPKMPADFSQQAAAGGRTRPGGTLASAFPAEPEGGEVTVGEAAGLDPFGKRPASPSSLPGRNVASQPAGGSPSAASLPPDPFKTPTGTPENPLRASQLAGAADQPVAPRVDAATRAPAARAETPLAGATPPRVLSDPDAPRRSAAPATLGVGRAGGRVYVVQDGDTLYDIARTELGKASRWGEIYDLNWDQLGNRLDALSPGMRLVLPADPLSQPEAVTRNPGPAGAGATLQR